MYVNYTASLNSTLYLSVLAILDILTLRYNNVIAAICRHTIANCCTQTIMVINTNYAAVYLVFLKIPNALHLAKSLPSSLGLL